jgi:hypothetical protein
MHHIKNKISPVDDACRNQNILNKSSKVLRISMYMYEYVSASNLE